MRELFWAVVSLSLSGTVLLAAVWILTRLLGGRLGRHWQYYVWLVVAARLLIPFTPEDSPMERLGNILFPVGTEQEALPEGPAGEEPLKTPPAQPEGSVPEEVPAIDFQWETLVDHLWVIWLLAALILLIRKVTLYQSFVKFLRAGQTEVSDPALLNLLGDVCTQAGIRRPPEFACNHLVASPIFLRMRRPAIVLPQIPEDREQLRLILLHELIHYKRRDIFYKWLLQFLLCVHWFNPFVHLMVREVDKACELSCDAAALSRLEDGDRRRYGEMLIDSLSAPGTYRESVAAVTLSENARQLKERLTAMKKFQKSKTFTAVLAVLLSACLFTGGFAAGVFTAGFSWNDFSGGVLTEEGLPVMSARYRYLYEQYLDPVLITGLFSGNFTPEDISFLAQENGSIMKSVFTALIPEVFEESAGAVPAKLVEDTLTEKLPIYRDVVRGIFQGAYDEESDTYEFYGGLGGGPNTVIITDSYKEGNLLGIQYTWYHYNMGQFEPGKRGEVIIRLDGDQFQYLSNQLSTDDK